MAERNYSHELKYASFHLGERQRMLQEVGLTSKKHQQHENGKISGSIY